MLLRGAVPARRLDRAGGGGHEMGPSSSEPRRNDPTLRRRTWREGEDPRSLPRHPGRAPTGTVRGRSDQSDEESPAGRTARIVLSKR